MKNKDFHEEIHGIYTSIDTIDENLKYITKELPTLAMSEDLMSTISAGITTALLAMDVARTTTLSLGHSFVLFISDAIAEYQENELSVEENIQAIRQSIDVIAHALVTVVDGLDEKENAGIRILLQESVGNILYCVLSIRNTLDYIFTHQLVTKSILGTRKGSEEPAYEHSVNVSEILKRHGYSDEVVIAGLLHDIVEDGGVSLQELTEYGFSVQIVQLVGLCSHDDTVKNKDARWVKMIARLIDENSSEAWAIKLADVLDNTRSCNTLSPDRSMFMRTVKAPLILAVTKHIFNESGIWSELLEEIKHKNI